MPRTTLLLATGLALASVPLFAEEYEAHRRLSFDPSARGRSASFHAMIGKQVKVDGTVYPAGNAYLIVVDSVRTTTP